MLERIIVGSGLALLCNFDLGLLFPICIFLVFMVVSILFKPYATARNNSRFAANMLTSIIVLAIYVFYRKTSLEEKNS